MAFSIVCLHIHLLFLFAYPYRVSPLTVFLTVIPNIFTNIYNEKPGIVGLHYIAVGVGLTTASQVNSRLLDRIYIHFKNKKGGVGEPEFRLRELLYDHLFSRRCGIDSQLPSDNGPCKYYRSLWTVAFRMGGTTSLALDSNGHRTLILTVLKFSRSTSKHFFGLFFLQGIACFGAGMIVSFQAIQTYIIDSFTLHAASGATLSIFCSY